MPVRGLRRGTLPDSRCPNLRVPDADADANAFFAMRQTRSLPERSIEVTEGTMHARNRFLCTFATSCLLLVGTARAGNTDIVTGTVIAVDKTTHTLTLKVADGKTSTTPVEGAALLTLGKLMPGETVSATFRDTSTGKHEAVTAITTFKTVAVFEDK
jgi:hypothetical protein